jgi:hypothetical protein
MGLRHDLYGVRPHINNFLRKKQFPIYSCVTTFLVYALVIIISYVKNISSV